MHNFTTINGDLPLKAFVWLLFIELALTDPGLTVTPPALLVSGQSHEEPVWPPEVAPHECFPRRSGRNNEQNKINTKIGVISKCLKAQKIDSHTYPERIVSNVALGLKLRFDKFYGS